MAILSAVAFVLVVTPLLDGLVSRASEHVGKLVDYLSHTRRGPGWTTARTTIWSMISR